VQYWQLFRGRIELPDIEMVVLLNCSKASCLGKWNYTVKKFFFKKPSEKQKWRTWSFVLLLDEAEVYGLLNIHDWWHRASCFKNDRDRCRYHTPHATVNVTRITPEFNAGNIDKINIEIRRWAVFICLTDCNSTFLSVLNCNNCRRYVLNQLVSLYYGCYTSKHTDENKKALAELMRAYNAYEAKVNVKQQQA
jgi:hypothetical protein